MLDELAKLAGSVGGALSNVSAEGKEVVFRMMDTLEMCLGGVGKFGQPVLTVLNAHAEGHAQVVQAKAVAKAEIAVRDEQIKALQRWSNIEIRRGKNLKKIVSEVDQYFGTTKHQQESLRIEQTPEAAEDWVYRFIDFCKDVGEKEMQGVWSRILAGELEHPGSVPVRLMHVVSLLTRKDAHAFRRVSGYAVTGPIEERMILWIDGIDAPQCYFNHLEDVSLLNSAGLIRNDIPTIIKMPHGRLRETEQGKAFPVRFGESAYGIPIGSHYSAYFFTEAGNRLSDLVGITPNAEYQKVLAEATKVGYFRKLI